MTGTDHVLLIPGTEGLAEVTFAGLVPLLARDVVVHTMDFTSMAGYDPEAQLDHYAAQVEKCLEGIAGDGRKIHLLGYSLGSLMALRVAARRVQPIDSLVLLGGWLRPSPPQRARHDLWLALFEADPRLAGEFSHLLQYSPEFLALGSELQTSATLTANIPTDETFHRVLVNQSGDNTAAASQTDCRTLIINGTVDQKVPLYCGYDLLGAIENSQLALVTSGHGLLRERLGEVYGYVKDFIDNTLPETTILQSPTV